MYTPSRERSQSGRQNTARKGLESVSSDQKLFSVGQGMRQTLSVEEVVDGNRVEYAVSATERSRPH